MQIPPLSPTSVTPPARAITATRPAAEGLRADLSPEELRYFADLDQLGPLTYGRRGARTDAVAPPTALGQRLDVRA